VRGHADAETLAAFREELLSRRKAARVSAHLAVCSRCAGLDAQLTEVSALLTTSTAPPMPDALTARIEAAIAAEAAARAATTVDRAVATADGTATTADGTGAVGAAGRGSGSHDRAARPARPARPPGGPGRARLALRVAAVTAAVVVVAGGGYGVARLLTANPGSATSAGGGGEAPPGVGGNASHAPAGGLRAPSAAGSSAPAAGIVSSGTDYQPGQLKTQVSAVLTQHRASASAPTGFSSANQPAASAPPVLACVPHVTGGKRPLLVDLAKYRGRPATVIVIPGATPGTLRALVVAGPCTAATGRVLAATTFPGSG
jgi:hypothetical protein